MEMEPFPPQIRPRTLKPAKTEPLPGSGFMPARRRYAGYLDDADGAKIGDGQVQVA